MVLAEYGSKGHSWTLWGSCLPLIPSGREGAGPPFQPLRQVCFGWRSDPATGPQHPTSLLPLSRGSRVCPKPPPSHLLPPLWGPLHLAPDATLFICLSPVVFWTPLRTGCPANIWHKTPCPALPPTRTTDPPQNLRELKPLCALVSVRYRGPFSLVLLST